MKGDLAGQRVALYARFSSDKQSDASIDDQIHRCTAFIEERGGTVDDSLLFTDHAISGATMARAGLDALLAAVGAGRVDVLVCEDMSRLSRDLGDAAQIFKRLQYDGVSLLGVADGIDSRDKSAKLNFGMRALLSDVYLEDLRDKTRRGLEGRHRSGKATGAVPFGYVTMRTGKGSTIEIDEPKARIVRRVFALYLDGLSLARIAKRLNADGVEVPRHHLKRAKGWTRSTIRSMLHQEKYAGIWRFNESEWRKDPRTGKRRRFKRPNTDVLTEQRPELAIVDDETWCEVRSRFESSGSKYRRRAKQRVYPLSGLLRCGKCGALMTVGGKGARARYYCSARRNRHTCDNSLSVLETRARDGIVRMMRSRLGRPAAVAYLRQRITELLGDVARKQSAEVDEHQARLERVERRVANLLAAVSEGMRSDVVYRTIEDLEAQAKQLRATITAIEADAREPDELVRRALEFEALLEREPMKAREGLARLFPEGVRLDPHDGVYVARATLYPLEVLALPQSKTAPSQGKRRVLLPDAGAGFEPTTFGL